MDMPEGAEGHSVASDGVGALIEGPKVAISQTRLYLDGAPGTHPQHQHPNSTRARYLTDISKSHRIFPKVRVYFFISRFFSHMHLGFARKSTFVLCTLREVGK